MKKLITILLLFLLGILLTSCSGSATEGLEFEAIEDGTYAITGYIGVDRDIVIPAEHNDRPVTTICDEVFEETDITSVSGGENITCIEDGSFSDCYMLEHFNIEGKYTQVNNNTFRSCTNLKEIYLPDTIERIGYQAFESCTSLETITLPESLLEIDEAAFRNCETLTISIPTSVTFIDKWAFTGCPNVNVEGSVANWNSNWRGRDGNTTFNNNDDSALPDAFVKKGCYKMLHTDEDTYKITNYIYVSDYELEWLTLNYSVYTAYGGEDGYYKTISYEYDVNGDTITCTPYSSNGGEIIELIYHETDEDTCYITASYQGGYRDFIWTQEDKPDDYEIEDDCIVSWN